MTVVYKMENVYQKYKGEKIMQMKILAWISKIIKLLVSLVKMEQENQH